MNIVQSPENNVQANQSESQQIIVNHTAQYEQKAAGFWIRFWAYTVDIVSFSFHWDVIDQTYISFVFIRHK